MLDHGIELAIFSLSGRLRGQLTPPRRRTSRCACTSTSCGEPDVPARLARELVAAKIRNGAAVLRRTATNHPEAYRRERGRRLEAPRSAPTAPRSLMRSSAWRAPPPSAYFGALGAMVPPELGFDGRNRRPPRDPVNALLSFGYVLVGNEIQALLDGDRLRPLPRLLPPARLRPAVARPRPAGGIPGALVDRLGRRPAQPAGAHRRGLRPDRGQKASTSPGGPQALLPGSRAGADRPLAARRGNLISFRQVFRRQAERLDAGARGRRALRALPIAVLIVVSYDVPDDRRRTRIANTLLDFGVGSSTRSSSAAWNRSGGEARTRVQRLIDAVEDSLRIYRFCQDCGRRSRSMARTGRPRTRMCTFLIRKRHEL